MATEIARGTEHWHAYRVGRNPALREELILKHLPLVRAVARRLLPALPVSVRVEDLESYGTIGLIEAVDSYDPGRGVRFETFAWPRIRGSILDHLRTLDMASRGDRHRARQIQQAFERESLRHGRSATDDEVAAALGTEVGALREEMGRLRNLIVHSMEDLVRGADEEHPRHQIPGPAAADPSDEFERAELFDALRRGLAELPDREKLVLGLYYYERLTLAEIAAILDLTESRVCQIQAAALLRLRSEIVRQGFTGC